MKKLLVSICIGLAVIMNATFAAAAAAPVFDTTRIENGIVAIAYNSDSDKRLKVMIEKSGKSMTYDLKNNGQTESFPLQMGDGQYKVSVLENTSGTKYKYVSSKEIALDINDDKKVYLASVQNIRWNSDMETVKLASRLTKGLDTDSKKIKAIYNYVVSKISYDYDKLAKLSTTYVPDVDSTLSSGTGICYDYSSVFAAMLRSQGIPAKLIMGYSPKVQGFHAWNEVYDAGTDKWIVIDTTFDSQKMAAKEKYSMEKSQTDYSGIREY
ncbi:MAG TPA: transglutaminase-like domain-containing protein [Clostridia bacterium]|nr:transglutaminase-like domain-containing protein [Clostridia bacterium]